MDIGELLLNIRTNGEEALDNVAGKLGKIGAVAGAAGAAVGTAAIAGTKAIIDQTGALAAQGDAIDKNSQKLGMSAESYQIWDQIAQHSGSSIESYGAQMKKMSANVVKGSKDASEGWKALGLSMDEVSNMSNEDMFSAAVSGLQGITDETERNKAAMQIFGKGYTELQPLLNTSKEDMDAMTKAIEANGSVLSDEAVKASAKFKDTKQELSNTFNGIKNSVVSQFLPDVEQGMHGLTDILQGNTEDGIARIEEAMEQVVYGIGNTIERFLPMIQEVLPRLLSELVEFVPYLVDDLTGVLEEILPILIDTIINMLPMLVETGMQVLLSLATGIAEALPELIPTIVDVVLQIIDTLINNVDLLIDAAIALITGLADGLIEAMPVLIEKAPEIVIKLVDAIIRNVPKLIEAGKNLIKKLWEGIKDWFPMLVTNAKQIIPKIVEGVKAVSHNILNLGKDIVNWLLDGIKNAWGSLTSWISEKVSNLPIVGNLIGSITGNATGLEYVPYDNMVARLHKGEMVLDRTDAEAFRKGRFGNEQSISNVFNITVPNNDNALETAMRLRDLTRQEVYGLG